jgi:hypothetical protein
LPTALPSTIAPTLRHGSYQGAYQFQKHFHGTVGELEPKGEEFECAKLIDTLPQVKFWIRNLSGRPQTSFWLPTSTDRFYPDFVAMLNDGRIFAIEYKGAHLAHGPDTLEKPTSANSGPPRVRARPFSSWPRNATAPGKTSCSKSPPH